MVLPWPSLRCMGEIYRRVSKVAPSGSQGYRRSWPKSSFRSKPELTATRSCVNKVRIRALLSLTNAFKRGELKAWLQAARSLMPPKNRKLISQEDTFYPPAPEGLVIYAIGDVHGRSDCLKAVLQRIDHDKSRLKPTSNSVEIYLGDFIDRGPDFAGCHRNDISAGSAHDHRLPKGQS